MNSRQRSFPILKTSKPNYFYAIKNPKIAKISSSFGVQVESEMMGGGRMGKTGSKVGIHLQALCLMMM